MTSSDIKRLLYSLPNPNCFAGPPPNPAKDQDLPPWDRTQCEAICLTNPAFGWLFVRTFIERDEPLPVVTTPELLKAYNYLAYEDWNEHVIEAIALTHPKNEKRCMVLKALLLVRDLPIEAIAQWTQLDPSTVSTFVELFWNVRERMDDRPYISGLVYPNGRISSSKLKTLSFEQQLLITAYEEGALPTLSLAGMVTRKEERKMRNQAKEPLDQLIFRSARAELEDGNAGAQVVALAVRLLQERERNQPDGHRPDPLTAISMTQPVMETIMAIQGPEIRARLQAQKRSQENVTQATSGGDSPRD